MDVPFNWKSVQNQFKSVQINSNQFKISCSEKRVALIRAHRRVWLASEQRLKQTKGMGTAAERSIHLSSNWLTQISSNQFKSVQISSVQFKSVQNQLLRKEGGTHTSTQTCVAGLLNKGWDKQKAWVPQLKGAFTCHQTDWPKSVHISSYQLLRKEGGACVCTRKCVRAAFKAKA